MNEQSTPQEKKDFALASLRAIMADGLPINENKMNCLYQIFATIEFDQPLERQNIVKMTIFDPEKIFDPEIIKRVLENDKDDEIRTELAKQAILACQTSGPSEANTNLDDFLIYDLKFSEEQISVLKEGVRWGNLMVDKLKRKNDDVKLSKDEKKKLQSLAERAKSLGLPTAAIGLPMTGLYFAGITGFSAVGITTGLAAIGKMTGLTLFGLLNPMTGGIVALIIGGLGIRHLGKKIINYFNKKRDRKAIEENMKKLLNLIRLYAEEDRKQFIVEKKSLEGTCQQYKEKEHALNDERNCLDQEIKSLDKQRESASFEREELDRKCRSLEQEMKALEEQNKTTSLEIEKIDHALDSLEQEKKALEGQKQSSIFERKKLEHGGVFRKIWNYLKGRTNKIIDLEIEEIENKIENCLSQTETNKKTKDTACQRIHEIEDKIKILLNEIDINKNNIESIDRKIVEIGNETKEVLDKIEHNQQQKEDISTEIGRLDLEIENLNRIIALLDRVIESHRSIDQMRLGHDSKPLLGFDGSE